MATKCFIVAGLVAACGLTAPVLAGAGDHAEVILARDSTGKLVVGLDFEMPVEIPESVFPGFPGHADSVPGFASLGFDEPLADRFVVDPAADLEVVLVSMDAGVGVLNSTGSAFLLPGETLYFGPSFFDYHPIWNIPVGEHGEVFSATFIARDRSGTHADSEPFTLTLTPAPCEGDFNTDNAVNTLDLVFFLGKFGGTFAHGDPGHEADLNHDGVVNTVDLVVFLGRFGQPC
jgi:hypothetical protein